MTYKVALEALSSDATLWEATSTALISASTQSDWQDLNVDQLSWAAEVTGLTLTYNALQTKVQTLLSQGGTETANIAKTLRTVKKNYEENEQKARESYKGTWDYK